MFVIQYEGEWKKYNQSGYFYYLTFLLLIMPNLIYKKMSVSDEVWRWVHWKYGMSQIVQNVHSIKINNCS